jgi:uncharacterized membrane protein YdjX (TVP38/TMEM64 family)
VLVTVTDVVSVDEVRDRVEATGAWAPLVFVVLAAALGALLVPGPLLAGASGLLFGPAVGTAVTLGSAVLTSTVAVLVGRVMGRRGLADVLGAERTARVDALGQRHGTVTVTVQRLLPGVPDAPMSYAFGAAGLGMRAVWVGTVVGGLPRAFSYTALGASLDDPTSPLALAGVVVLVAVTVVGAELGRRAWARRRRG